MSLNIKDPETHRLAKQLAEATGETMTEAVREALKERLSRVERRGMSERLLAIGEEMAARMSEDVRTSNPDDWLYDEYGLPQMIVDTSALVAIARKEPDRDKYTLALELAGGGSMSAATYLETSIVIDHERDPILSRQLDDLIAAANIEIVPVTAHQARMARAAYRDFGKGSGHAARLNFGDCYSYALAKAVGEPLLFKGNDFSETDVADALDRPGE